MESHKRLSTITEYSESIESEVDGHENLVVEYNEPMMEALDADSEGLTRRDVPDFTVERDTVRYFFVDDSPLAKFSRSVMWACKKVSAPRPAARSSSIADLPFTSLTTLSQQLPVGGGGAVLVLSELESMAARQQREIAQQKRLLEQREARLAVLRGAQEPAQQDRLARLRHRLDQQQSKLNRLRLLRSQTDQSRANNATLTSDLDCIRALFNEKEKELSLAVAKVEELTRQLEELRGRHTNGGGHLPTPASAELEKLRRELMYRNKMNEQQNQVVSQQRLALAQRQAEMASIDARIAQLQGRLQRKRALNQRLSQQLGSNRGANHQNFADSKLEFNSNKSRPAGNIAAIEPYSHIPSDDFALNKNDPKYQTLPYNTKFTVNFKTDDDVNKNKIQHSASASQIGQRSFQQFGHQIVHSQSQSHIQGQSQPLGTTTNSQSVGNFGLGNNNNNNNNSHNNNNNNVINNNNNNNNTSTTATSTTTITTTNNNNTNNANNNASHGFADGQNLRIHGHPHNQKQQQQQQHGGNNSPGSSLVGPNQSTVPNQNHRNSTSHHQKPVSSVAPSFPVKSPIYQTSSTKIHPVMPQTLSLIGHGSSAPQNYPANGQVVGIAQEQNYNPRQNFTAVSQHVAQGGSCYQSQHSPNLSSSACESHGQIQSSQNFPNHPCHGYAQHNQGQSSQQNQHTSSSSEGQERGVDRSKFESVNRVDQNVMKYENKFEQNQSGKSHDQTHGKYDHVQIKHDSQLKFDHNMLMGKYEQMQQQQQQQQFKHDPNQLSKFNDNSGQLQQQSVKFDHHSVKYDQNPSMKHDHANKFEPPSKPLDKPFEYDRMKYDAERKSISFESKGEDKTKPALPPKPSKPNPPPRLIHHDKIEVGSEIADGKASIVAGARCDKEEDIPPIPTSEPPESPTEAQAHQIIKARPLTLKKALLSEQPKLRYSKSNVHVSINRRIEMPPAFLFPETEIPADLMQSEQTEQLENPSKRRGETGTGATDEVTNEKLEDSDIVDALNVLNVDDRQSQNDKLAKVKIDTVDRGRSEVDLDIKAEVIRRKKGNLKSTTGKVNLSRRVSFDPLALLLDASLEGELELVKKTAKEVANPSSANDEGITALHNAICAGHLEIVKFLVEFGCDVNAQDSDGWTPLHCAASCNNLAMVRFLVEHGACIFATTLSDHETAAEKCEEDEEGFDGCSEYLYSVQEKLGIMNNGQVFAVFDYEAQHSDELSLKNGDSLVVLRKGDDNEREWWWSKLGHREGYVPRNLLGLYARVQPAKVD